MHAHDTVRRSSDNMSDEPTGKKGKGTIFVLNEVCKGCSFCIDFCPPKCLSFSREYNRKGYHYPVLATPETCTGCDLCGLYCPDFAIYGVRYRDMEKRVHEASEAKV